MESLRDWYWWPGMHLTVAECLRSCDACQKDKGTDFPAVPIQESWKGTGPFQGWHIDLAGPFPPDADGCRYIWLAVDPFSKWVEAELLPTKQSWRTARALYALVSRWGKPHWVTTDNG